MNHLLHLNICPTCLLLFLFCFTTPSTADDANRTLCQPMSCGSNTTNISYPFWIMGKQKPYCGIPAFKLTCKGGAPVLSISLRDYYILDVFYNNNSILVVDGVLHNNTTSCPRPVRNITLEMTPFSINSAYNNSLRFFVDCKEPVEVHGFMPCSGSKTYVGDNLMVLGQWKKFNSCDYSLVVPSCRKVEANPSGYLEVLRKGFVLDWKAHDCGRCSGSGGTCGYDTTINSFMCMCPDRSHAAQCHDGDERWRRKVAIAGGSLFAGFMLGSLCLYLWYRQRKNKMQSTSLKNLFRNSSSQNAAMDEDTELGRYSAHIFSYEELQEATDGFATSNELGDGGFGTVYKGKLRDGRVVAVKRLYENNFKRLDHFINEVSILNLLRHQNLVTLYGCTSHQSRELVLVYEYVPNGTVADHLHGCRAEEKALTWPIRLRIAIETAGALAYLHAIVPQIIHRDVKTNNILLDENFHVKVADFGLSRLFPPHASHVSTVPQGTPGYVDPEYHQCYQLTDKSDVYSFGVVLVELFSSMEAVDITRHRHEINLSNLAISRIQSRRLGELVDPKLGYDSDRKVRKMVEAVAELAFRCLQAEKEMRPSMEEVLKVLKVIANLSAEDEIPDDAGKTKTCDISFLKGSLHHSPDSVAAQWISRSTTPNTSS